MTGGPAGPNIAGALFATAAERPGEIAIHYPAGPRSKGRARYHSVTYAALAADAHRIAAGLSTLGIDTSRALIVKYTHMLQF